MQQPTLTGISLTLGALILLSLGAVIFLVGWVGGGLLGSQPALQSTPPPTLEPSAASLNYTAYTYQNPDGNRYVVGQGTVPESVPLDVPLAGVPVWLLGAPLERLPDAAAAPRMLWIAVLENGAVQAFTVTGRAVEAVSIAPEFLPPGMPPLLHIQDGAAALLSVPPEAAAVASVQTHPIPLPDDQLAFIEAESGDVVIWDRTAGEEVRRHAVDALPDARLIYDPGANTITVLAGRTTAYDHGALGDGIEALGYQWFQVNNMPLGGGPAVGDGGYSASVIEGIAPILADINGDGERETIITVTNRASGARLVSGGAASDSIGQGYRWRHQIAVAPFGPGGEIELVSVRTPHIGGVVEFMQLAGRTLEIVAAVSGFSSHQVGSRNLDMAAAGDFDGDQLIELLVPTQDYTQLGAVGRTVDGAEVRWLVAIGGQMVTNLAVAPANIADDATPVLAVGAGRADGVLRLWLPE